MKTLEKLTTQLHHMTCARNELRGILANYTDKDLSNSYLYAQVLRDSTQLKKNVHVLRLQNRLMQKEKIELQETCEEVKMLFKETYEKIRDPCAEEHQEQEILENLQKEPATQERDLAKKLKHHFSVSEMRSENLQSHLEQAPAQDESLLQTELLQQEH